METPSWSIALAVDADPEALARLHQNVLLALTERYAWVTSFTSRPILPGPLLHLRLFGQRGWQTSALDIPTDGEVALWLCVAFPGLGRQFAQGAWPAAFNGEWMPVRFTHVRRLDPVGEP